MKRATAIIEKIAAKSDEVILFHSASGKDSIALLDLLSPYFKRIICVYMYVVKDLRHINRYVRYAERRYPNAKFIQVPHFNLSYSATSKDSFARKFQMTDVANAIRERYGIEWAFFGFKKSDSMNRRLMLSTYEDEAINEKSKACYPLSSYKNSDVLDYIRRNGLIRPESYGKGQSAGTAVADINYLLFLRANYPDDLTKVLARFPMSERILFEYDYDKNQAERNENDLEESDQS